MNDLLESLQENWNWLELGWTVAAMIGIVLSSRALDRATQLRKAALDEGMEWPTRRRLTKRIRDAAGALFRHIGFAIVGIAAMASPPAPRNPEVDYTPGLAVAVVFVAVIIWDIVSLEWDSRDWTAITRALIRDPGLWDRLIEDEGRVQKRQAAALGGETLPDIPAGRTSTHHDS